MVMPNARFPVLLVLLVASLLLVPLQGAGAGDEAADRVRKRTIKKLEKDLRKEARNPRPLTEERQMRVLELIEALAVFGGADAAEAGLEGVPIRDEQIRDAVFGLVDSEHGPELVGPLSALLEAKAYRRDVDVRKRVARSLSVAADPRAVLPLATLIRSDEDATVVAAAADALATYGAAPLKFRREAVRQLVDVYTTTYNLMLSTKSEQRVIRSVMQKRWKVYAGSVRAALQDLTGQRFSRPQEWRTWWNKNKKKKW